ncbi:putative E3 ubiquitin-protein ligase UBR7 [Aplysia californica]|uniref:E3 ubiquitin-protein ligase UBR7 n=1 Tax=Aplysia californica TaxID=6500 RepID=A0ABM0JT26_APLCA|nr:putative E3 ubiquitin-protein ligase UBR7 [Aplysia californica]
MEEERNNTRRCGQIGEGDEDELSMVDVLNEQARLQADANAVLGGSDEHNCTYPSGYLKRQALYACATCSPDGLAGVCLACSYACHEGHELYELYTKRHFRCDCGNEKFGNKACKLYAGKMEHNTKNRYNQNFKGVYCSCSRPYPDPEDTVEDEMIQCVVCEDWHHGRHLNIPVPEKDFSEMICPACMAKHQFLWAYHVQGEVTEIQKEETDIDNSSPIVKVEVEEAENKVKTETSQTLCAGKCDEAATSLGHQENGNVKREDVNGHNGVTDVKGESSDQTSPGKAQKRERQESDSAQKAECSSPKKMKPDVSDNGVQNEVEGAEAKDKCLLKALQCREMEHPETAAFWPEGWRQKLCRCVQCMEMYKDKNIEFLCDELDTVQAYEDKGRDTASNTEESEASALAGMDRVQQIEVVRGFIDMKSQLNEFLQGFVRDGKVVTESDIREFFQSMQQRRRGQIGVPQRFCR